MTSSQVREMVSEALLEVLETTRAWDSEASLVEDLGLDSLKLVDLVLALEDRLGVGELPIQEWLDQQQADRTAGFTVGSLVDACCELVQRTTTLRRR